MKMNCSCEDVFCSMYSNKNLFFKVIKKEKMYLILERSSNSSLIVL